MQYLKGEQGVGLVEVLVAVLLLSVAVLGFSALQLQAVKATDESLIRTQAMSIIRGLAENMRANPLQVDAYQSTINTPSPTASTCSQLKDECSSAQIAIKEANAAVSKLQEYGIKVKMYTCPGTSSFSEIKCIVAAWGDTEPNMAGGVNSCASSDGNYKSGKSCIIVEAY